MEKKCKNCMCYSPATHHSDGTKGTCGQSGELLVHDREEFCSCGMFMELPKKEKLARTIERDLHAWIRERDAMFNRSMELVCHIGHLFEQGEFKVFDVVKSASEMKSLVFFGKPTLTELDKVWTYHCPWNDDIEFFIVITQSGKLVVNSWMNDKFVFEWFDIEEDFEKCMSIVDKIRQNCILGADATNVVTEVEQNKCVSSLDEVTEIIHPINREDDELPPPPPVINLSSIRYPR